jgi:hypothetical protein
VEYFTLLKTTLLKTKDVCGQPKVGDGGERRTWNSTEGGEEELVDGAEEERKKYGGDEGDEDVGIRKT